MTKKTNNTTNLDEVLAEIEKDFVDRILSHDDLRSYSKQSSWFRAVQNVRLSFTFSSTSSFPVPVSA